MAKITYVSIAGLALALALLLGCGGLGLAVREGAVGEALVRFPPETRFQVILRVGPDALPWDYRSQRPTAINLWVHDDERTSWHIVKLLGIPLGRSMAVE